jgi:hypothetical protein
MTPFFLPDNRRFLFVAINQRSSDSAVYEGSLDSPEVQRIMSSPMGPVYVIEDELIFVRDSTLMTQKFDWRNARLQGEPRSLHERVYANPSSYDPVASFSASARTLAYFPEGHPNTELVWLDRRGNRIASLGSVAHYTNPALSPDQKRVAVGTFQPGTNQRDIWILDEHGGTTQLTNNPQDDFNPFWSPDGARIAFTSDRMGVRDLFVKAATPASREEVLLSNTQQKSIESWSPDGKYIIFNEPESLQALALEGDHKPFQAVDGPGVCDQAALSPDGKWIAYRSHNGGHVEVYIQRFPRGGAYWQISKNGGGEPKWRGDGKELYFALDKQIFAVDIKEVAGGIEHGEPRLLFTTPLTVEIRRNRYVPSADGQRFLVVAQSEQRGMEPHIVINWRSTLKKD